MPNFAYKETKENESVSEEIKERKNWAGNYTFKAQNLH